MKSAFLILALALSGCASHSFDSTERVAARWREQSQSKLILSTAQGQSNWPYVKPGDILLIRPAQFTEAQHIGAFIAFAPHWQAATFGEVTAHYVIEVRADGRLVTQGKNNPKPDPSSVGPENFVGVAVNLTRNLN